MVPKGWPAPGLTPAEAAAREAWEEAGVIGLPEERCIGIYSYMKEDRVGSALPCVVALFPLRVQSLSGAYPEVRQRRRKWMGRKKAALKVTDPELSRLLRQFDPR